MKALNITQYTGIDGLQYQDVPEPTPGPGQVTIRAEYAGVGYVDALLAEGMAELPFPWAPGIEAAGRIHALGEGVTGLRVGDKVAAPLTLLGSGGGFGQICLAQANLVAPLPAGMNPALAAVVPANTPTALAALERTARLQPGEHVLVQAAMGGLGTQFGQVAKLMGAEKVVGIVSTEEKRRLALELGYDEVWLRDELADKSGRQFDVIIDPVSGRARPELLKLLRFEGRLIVVGNAAQDGDQTVGTNTFWFDGISMMGFNIGLLSNAYPDIATAYLRRALALVASGEVTVPIQEEVDIRDGAQALERLRAGKTIGKFVFRHEPYGE